MAETLTSAERKAIRADVMQMLNRHFAPDVRGQLLRQLRFWHWFSGFWMLMTVSGYVGMFILAMRPGLIPYPVIYTPDGVIIHHGQAETTREERFIDVGLLEWVLWMRAVPSDETVFREYREMAQAHVYGKALEKFTAYNKETIAAYLNPHKRVLVKVDRTRMTITRKGAKQVWIGWHETWTPQFGFGAEVHQFEAVIDYDWFAQPRSFTLAQARANPRRLYVTDYSWDEVRQGVR